ncbi:MAG: outer membrane protein assembly factor BamD [Gammaproteobacteria bacterium]
MRNLKYVVNMPKILVCIMLGISLAACGGKNKRDMLSGADILYDEAVKAADSGNYRNAIAYYETLEARYPFSNQAKQGQLNLIYVYYKNGEAESTVDAAIQFERENPTHPRVDYALYMQGLAYFGGEHGRFHRLFNVDLSERPPVDAIQSFDAFSKLVRRYPDSLYVADARQRMIFLRNRLADHENHIARYYMKRGAYAAAINRAQYSIKVYDGAPAIPESLMIMIDGYHGLGMTDLAEETERVLAASYPDVKRIKPKQDAWYKFW